jgi:hypothetical protein
MWPTRQSSPGLPASPTRHLPAVGLNTGDYTKSGPCDVVSGQSLQIPSVFVLHIIYRRYLQYYGCLEMQNT